MRFPRLETAKWAAVVPVSFAPVLSKVEPLQLNLNPA
jgi:hypothetical protein